jgi:hypothetical protein
MRVNSNLLGAVAKALKGASQIESGDSKLLVPGILQPTIALPFPFIGGFDTTVTTLGIVRDSIMLNEARQMSVTNLFTALQLGAGVWEIIWQHFVRPQGGVDDLTSFGLIQVAAGPVGSTMTLSRVANSRTPFQSLFGRFVTTIEGAADGTGVLSIFHRTIGGLGTGTSLSEITLIANKLM